MRRFIIGLVLTALLAGPGFAQRSPVVVELFTSQGCSSCPPADEMLKELAQREDVIAVALHVDYWDYIGWKDEFADPRNATRQRAYAVRAHRRAVYTPQFIVNGTTDIVGAKPMAVAKAIADHQMAGMPVTVTLTRDGDAVHITAKAVKPIPGPVDIHTFRYHEDRDARITRGENAGRRFTYANVTEGWQVLRHWDGQGTAEVQITAPGPQPVVVLVQERDAGVILGAGRLR